MLKWPLSETREWIAGFEEAMLPGESMHSCNLAGALALAIALSPLHPAWAEVGAVAALEGESARVASSGESVALQVGSKLELGDALEVKSGNLKLVLNDESEIVLGTGSRLRIDEAEFKQLEHRRFSAWLFFGSLWSRVTKALAGSDAKFEVVTDCMVAGVRGTVFRVDVFAGASNEKETLVHVLEGRVGVAHRDAPHPDPSGAKPKVAELSPGERAWANREGMRKERGTPPPKEAFERFIRSHERASHDSKERHLGWEKGPKHR